MEAYELSGGEISPLPVAAGTSGLRKSRAPGSGFRAPRSGLGSIPSFGTVKVKQGDVKTALVHTLSTAKLGLAQSTATALGSGLGMTKITSHMRKCRS